MSQICRERVRRQAMLEKMRMDTIEKLKFKNHHIRRVANGESVMNLRTYNVREVFAKDYRKFYGCYTREQLQFLENSFLSADGDGDRRLSQVEVMHWFQTQGYPLSSEELLGILEMADSDLDGYLSFEEFVILCLRMEVRNIPNETKFVAGKTIDPDFQYCVCNVNHYRNKKTKGQKGQSSNVPKSTGELIQESANQIQQRLSAVRKFSSIILPGLKTCGVVNIAHIIDYFETEIFKQTDLKSQELQARMMMSEAKRSYKRNAVISAAKSVQLSPFLEPKVTIGPLPSYQQPRSLPNFNRPNPTIEAKVEQPNFPSISKSRNKINATASKAVRNVPSLKGSGSMTGIPRIVQESIQKAKALGIPPYGTTPPTNIGPLSSHENEVRQSTRSRSHRARSSMSQSRSYYTTQKM